MAGNVRGTGCGLLPACGRVRYPEEKLASRQRRRAGHGVPGRGVLVFVEVKIPYGEWLWRCPTRCECPQKGSDTPGSGGMASPASGTGEFPLRCCGSPVQGREAPGIPAYPRGIRGEGFVRFMKIQGKAVKTRRIWNPGHGVLPAVAEQFLQSCISPCVRMQMSFLL